VQNALNHAGYRPALITDGIFGEKTEAGVQWFQRARKLHRDGIVGPETYSALGIR